MKQQTPLQKLIDKLNQSIKLYEESGSYDKFARRIDDLKDIIKEAESLLPEEKQMVIDAFDTAVKFRFSSNSNEAFKQGEQYFNETYNETRPTKEKH